MRRKYLLVISNIFRLFIEHLIFTQFTWLQNPEFITPKNFSDFIIFIFFLLRVLYEFFMKFIKLVETGTQLYWMVSPGNTSGYDEIYFIEASINIYRLFCLCLSQYKISLWQKISTFQKIQSKFNTCFAWFSSSVTSLKLFFPTIFFLCLFTSRCLFCQVLLFEYCRRYFIPQEDNISRTMSTQARLKNEELTNQISQMVIDALQIDNENK